MHVDFPLSEQSWCQCWLMGAGTCWGHQPFVLGSERREAPVESKGQIIEATKNLGEANFLQAWESHLSKFEGRGWWALGSVAKSPFVFLSAASWASFLLCLLSMSYLDHL